MRYLSIKSDYIYFFLGGSMDSRIGWGEFITLFSKVELTELEDDWSNLVKNQYVKQ